MKIYTAALPKLVAVANPTTTGNATRLAVQGNEIVNGGILTHMLTSRIIEYSLSKH
jgi:hypothetical protein